MISSYHAPLAQRASYLALHSSRFEPQDTVNYDYIVTNSIIFLAQHVFSFDLVICEFRVSFWGGGGGGICPLLALACPFGYTREFYFTCKSIQASIITLMTQ